MHQFNFIFKMQMLHIPRRDINFWNDDFKPGVFKLQIPYKRRGISFPKSFRSNVGMNPRKKRKLYLLEIYKNKISKFFYFLRSKTASFFSVNFSKCCFCHKNF